MVERPDRGRPGRGRGAAQRRPDRQRPRRRPGRWGVRAQPQVDLATRHGTTRPCAGPTSHPDILGGDVRRGDQRWSRGRDRRHRHRRHPGADQGRREHRRSSGDASQDHVPPISQLKVTTHGKDRQRRAVRRPGARTSSDGVIGTAQVHLRRQVHRRPSTGSARLQMGAFLDSEDVKADAHLRRERRGLPQHGRDLRRRRALHRGPLPAVARRAVTGTSLGAINRGNVDRPLRVWGVSADATAVQVGVEDRNGSERTWPATLTGTGTAQTWSVTFPAREPAAASRTARSPSAPPTPRTGVVLAGVERTICKDTVAPARPRIRPRRRVRSSRRETVRLRAPGAREIWYTLSGDQARPEPWRGVPRGGSASPAARP